METLNSTLILNNFYSVLKLFTGFATAALIDLYPTVINAIRTEINTASSKTPIPIRMR